MLTKLLTFTAAAAIASNVYGAACSKIEYAEAKDWPLEQLERAYCADVNAITANLRTAMAQRSAEASNAVLRFSDACVDNTAMFQRIRENVHKKTGVPACPKQK